MTQPKHDRQPSRADVPWAEVPRAVIARMSRYLRELEAIRRSGETTTSSRTLGRLLGFTDSQVRKDLAWFGHFGRPGVGYRCDDLIINIREILGTNKVWHTVLVGCGNLGQALLGYQGFEKQGFKVVAAVDRNPQVIGTVLNDLQVQPFERLAEIVDQLDIKLAILAVPANQAEQAAVGIVKAGIAGILNFAPVTLNLGEQVQVSDVDLAMELQQLLFSVIRQQES